jgi:hypothetical protein
MSGIPTPKSSMANAIKIYFFPSLVTVLAMMIWRDVTEMRSDVKMLLGQSNIDKTEIQQLKKQVDQLNRQVFKTPIALNNTDFENTYVLHDKYFKHEDFYNINDYLPKTDL